MKKEALMLALYVGPIMLVMGLSLLLYSKQWLKLISEYSKNHFLMLPHMFMALVIGLIMVNMHNVWAWDLSLVITLIGWGALLKGVFYLLAPSSWIKAVMGCKCYQNTGFMMVWGAVVLVLGGCLTYYAYDLATLLA